MFFAGQGEESGRSGQNLLRAGSVFRKLGQRPDPISGGDSQEAPSTHHTTVFQPRPSKLKFRNFRLHFKSVFAKLFYCFACFEL